jgi:hypothetical protein
VRGGTRTVVLLRAPEVEGAALTAALEEATAGEAT